MSEQANQNSSRFLRKSIRLALQLAGVLVIGSFIGAAGLAWRLTSGPVSIAALTPYFESALSSRTGSYMVSVDDTILKWVGGDRAVDLILRGTRVLSPEGQICPSSRTRYFSQRIGVIERQPRTQKPLFFWREHYRYSRYRRPLGH